MPYKFNPFTGTLDLVNTTGAIIASILHFSFKRIIASSTVTILTNEQMIVVDEIEVLGQLNIDGELALIEG